MSCEQARQYVNQFLQDRNVQVGKEQVDAAVSVCCNDVKSQACADALSTLAATGVCAAYTEGACIPCCEVLGSIAGPIIGAGLGAAVDVIEAGWDKVKDFFSSIFGGGGGCSYKPVADAINAAYSKAGRDLSGSVGEAWIAARMKLMGFDYLDGDWPIVRADGPGGLFVPTYKGDPKAVAWAVIPHITNPWQAWTFVILRNATIFAAASKEADYPNKTYWEYDGGRLDLPGLDPAVPPATFEQYFFFKWDGWPCHDPGEFEKAAKHAMRIRWHFVDKAVNRFLSDMMVTTTQEIQKAEMTAKVVELAKRAAEAEKKREKGTSPLAVLGILGALSVLGYGIWRYSQS